MANPLVSFLRDLILGPVSNSGGLVPSGNPDVTPEEEIEREVEELKVRIPSATCAQCNRRFLLPSDDNTPAGMYTATILCNLSCLIDYAKENVIQATVSPRARAVTSHRGMTVY